MLLNGRTLKMCPSVHVVEWMDTEDDLIVIIDVVFLSMLLVTNWHQTITNAIYL